MALEQTITSFRASDVPSGQLGPILADYLALQRLKIFRRLLVERVGLVAAGAGIGAYLSGGFSALDVLGMVAALMAIPGAAWVSERRAAARLASRLSGVRKS